MRYHLFLKLFGKMVKIKEMSFLSTRGMGLMFGNCILKKVMLKYYYESQKSFFYTNLNVIRILMNWLAGSSVSRDLRASICLWLYY